MKNQSATSVSFESRHEGKQIPPNPQLSASWLDTQVSLYSCHSDNTGSSTSLRNVLLTQFGIAHKWFYKDDEKDKWISGNSIDLDSIIMLRKLEVDDPDYSKKSKLIKATIQGYTPAALLKSRQRDNVIISKRTGILQLDWDYGNLADYYIEEAKAAVFSLPFIAFCGLSCSGKGFYALAMISEPERLKEYADHCFVIFDKYGLAVDTSKGENVNDLRYLSYDANMLIRDNPTPLKIKRFFSRKSNSKVATNPAKVDYLLTNDIRLKNLFNELATVQTGSRWKTCQRVGYTMGGLKAQLQEGVKIIESNPAFAGEEDKYIKCLTDCYEAGLQKTLL